MNALLDVTVLGSVRDSAAKTYRCTRERVRNSPSVYRKRDTEASKTELVESF